VHANQTGIAPSVGSRGDSYDNALAESIIGLFKTEVIQRKGAYRSDSRAMLVATVSGATNICESEACSRS
jgi:transposase InsO family protein